MIKGLSFDILGDEVVVVADEGSKCWEARGVRDIVCFQFDNSIARGRKGVTFGCVEWKIDLFAKGVETVVTTEEFL